MSGRTAAMFLLLALLAGCAPVLAPLGTANDTPSIEDGTLLVRDGTSLPLRQWDAEKPRAIIVALHGMGGYSNDFDMPAAWWAVHGITTYAYDQRGFGRAPNPGLWAGEKALPDDFTDCVEAVRATHPGLPVFALGESMGGAVVLTALASPEPPLLDGAILVAPAVWAREDMPFSYRAALWLGAHTVPWLELSGKGLNLWPSDNIPMLRAYARDPLVQKVTRADAVWGLVDLMDAARKAPAHLDDPPPILLLYGDKDQIVPREPTLATIKDLGARATVHAYADGYHMLLRDLEGPAVWKDIADWLAQQR
jgi:alpha-beta hydrolase superfamily lysophospholipase